MTRSSGRLMVAAAAIAAMLGVLAVGFTATALANGTFLDEFGVIGFSGDDGSLPWSGPWYEIGESDGPNAGAVRVKVTSDCVAKACIEIGKLSGNDGSAIGRQADLSGAGSAVLYFSYKRENSLVTGTGIRLLASATGASPWTQVAYYSLDAEDAEILHAIVSLTGFIGPSTGIRFVIDGDLAKGRMNIDNVAIVVSGIASPSSTTTTTTTTTTVPPTGGSVTRNVTSVSTFATLNCWTSIEVSTYPVKAPAIGTADPRQGISAARRIWLLKPSL